VRRPRRSPLAAAPIAAALLLAACVSNPVTGRSEFTLMSPEREIALGRQAAEQVETEIGLVDAPELTAYVEGLGQRLALSSPRRDLVYRFAVADMEEPNAFALPGGWDAYRSWSQARSQSGDVAIDLTWIAHPDATLRITGVAGASRFRVHAESFRATARSVRPLQGAERAGLKVRRLRIARARRGERLAALSRRTGNVWSAAETAIANALPQEAELERGELVKIAVEVPYAR
jgi:predicted Zn-dependent protease